MDRIIKEEILRINELMNHKLIVESDYEACQRFSDNKRKQYLCYKIVSLKTWIFKPWGLNLRQIIDDKIDDLKTDTPDELKQKFIDGAELLYENGKITEEEKNNFIDRVMNNRLVYVNGVWQPLNKLNTNYYDLGELITDLIYKGGKRSQELIQEIIEDPKKGLTKLKPYIEDLLGKYFKNPEVFNEYTKVTAETSRTGQEAEDKVKNELEKLGFKEEYSGGNGDLIDMVFGTDLIMSSPKHGFKTIQVKRNKNAWRVEEKYPHVDWVVIANPFTIYDNKTKEEIKL